MLLCLYGWEDSDSIPHKADGGEPIGGKVVTNQGPAFPASTADEQTVALLDTRQNTHFIPLPRRTWTPF